MRKVNLILWPWRDPAPLISLSACPGFSDADNHDGCWSFAFAQLTSKSIDNYSSSLSNRRPKTEVPTLLTCLRQRSWSEISTSEDSCLRFHRFITFLKQPIQMTIVDCKILSLIISFYCPITI